MRLTRIGHVLIGVHDLSRSKDFYTRILGFELVEEDFDHGGVFMTIGKGAHVIDLVPIPGKQLARIPQSFADLEPSLGFGHVAFAVDSARDLRCAYFELIDNGVRILGAVDHETQESIYFCDPDGNMLEIYWERPDAREIFRRGRNDRDRLVTFTRNEIT